MSKSPVSESELKDHQKAMGGRRVTLEDVNGAIAAEHFFSGADGVFGARVMGQAGKGEPIDCTALSIITFCVLVLKNGFTATGQAACADPSMFNEEIGRRIAREDAVNKIWPLLGFLLREEMYRERAYRRVGAGASEASSQAAEDGAKASGPDVLELSVPDFGKLPVLNDLLQEETFYDRLVVEYDQLAERLGKLETFLKSSQINGLPRTDLELLEHQASHMGHYRMILSARLARARGQG